jgi:formylglycine-generating enzyme required for sulfatase activity
MRKEKSVIAACCLALACLATAGASSAAGLETRTNSIGVEFVLIPAGSFMMGTQPEEYANEGDERPLHEETVNAFYLGKYEVTQAQWAAVMGSNPFQGERACDGTPTVISNKSARTAMSWLLPFLLIRNWKNP